MTARSTPTGSCPSSVGLRRGPLLVLVLMTAAACAAEPVDLGPLLAEALAGRVPGGVAAVIVDGRIHGLGTVGVRRRGEAAPVRIGDRFHLGSCTKAMTATIAAQLVEQGRLRWRSTAGEVLGAASGTYSAVTLEQLLAHRAGAPGDVSDLDGAAWAGFMRSAAPPEAQRAAMVALLTARPPLAVPGARYAYSNLGYVLAGRMLEVAAGAPWEALMRERLFAPLGMASAGFGPPTRRSADEPSGHHQPGPADVPELDNPAGYGPAGTVHASIADWAAFVRAHLLAEGAGLARPESWRELHRSRGDGYALGWQVGERAWAQGEVLSHNGSNGAWSCVTWLAPRRRFAALVAANSGEPGVMEALDAVVVELVRRF